MTWIFYLFNSNQMDINCNYGWNFYYCANVAKDKICFCCYKPTEAEANDFHVQAWVYFFLIILLKHVWKAMSDFYFIFIVFLIHYHLCHIQVISVTILGFWKTLPASVFRNINTSLLKDWTCFILLCLHPKHTVRQL